ncbi:MAG: DUF2285 domain-containing protein [Alphaproteobacteria bacterium]|nr:DUF2285 domain-containing protein [Alphaproteobacteria bacterium]
MQGRRSRSIAHDGAYHQLNCGVFAPFANPAVPAPTSPVVWTGASGARIIEARAGRSNISATGDLDMAEPSAVVHIHIDPIGNQHVVLSSSRQRVQMVITGVLITCSPVTLAFESLGVRNLRRAASDFTVLTQLLVNHAPLAADDRPGLVERRELRDALIALDGKARGASHRDIAKVIYGSERAVIEWGDSDSSMRQKIKRHLARGRRLMTGGYRDLLGRWQQRSLEHTG